MDLATVWRMLTGEEPPDLPPGRLRQLDSLRAFQKLLGFGMPIRKTVAEHRELMDRLAPLPDTPADDPPPTVH